MKYFEDAPAPWEDVAFIEGGPKKKRKEDEVLDVEIAETCLRFLRIAPDHFKTLWKWSEFARKFLKHADNHVKRQDNLLEY